MIRLVLTEDPRRSGVLTQINTKINVAIEGTRKTMEGRVRGIGKFFTKNIQDNIRADGKNHISTGRLLADNAELVQLYTSTTSIENNNVSDVFYFNYTLPENNGYEYGYAFGNKDNKLQNIDAVADWVMKKGTFKYWVKVGDDTFKVLPITKKYQARSVALMMIRKGADKERPYNVHNWYKITVSDKEIESRLKTLSKLWHYTFSEENKK